MRILVNEFCGHPFQIELSREFARRGHNVLHVYFADNTTTPKGNVDSGDAGRQTCAIEGLHIPFQFSKHSLRSRRRADIAYGRAVAAKVAEFMPDVVISANMPLDAQNILQKAALLQKAKFVFWLQDVYSSAIGFVLKKKIGRAGELAAKLYERLERRLLQSSDAVVCIAPGFSKVTEAWGIESSRTFMIENWAPLDEVIPTQKNNPWARENELEDKFCFVYSGTLGMKHRPELLLALAQQLQNRPGACLVVVAAGAGFEWLQEQAKTIDPRVLKLLPFQPYERLSEVLGTADVLLALLDADAGAFAVPSKTLSYLCAGRALMCAAPRQNHAAVIVENAKVGVVVSPERADEFLVAADDLIEQVLLRRVYGANARAYAERCFAIGPIADRFLDVFERSEMHPASPQTSASLWRQLLVRTPLLSAGREA
jgi:colanic acid biosynthesis glycosyl transferase WcaI